MGKIKVLLLRTKFIDENYIERRLEIRQWPKVGLEPIYTCIIIGGMTMDIRRDNEDWYDLKRQDDGLANTFGRIITKDLDKIKAGPEAVSYCGAGPISNGLALINFTFFF